MHNVVGQGLHSKDLNFIFSKQQEFYSRQAHDGRRPLRIATSTSSIDVEVTLSKF
jgi:hypothetical protein